MTFNERLNNRTKEVTAVISRYLPKEEGFQKTLYCAMNYSMMAGGKRLRPLLMQETFRMFGGESEIVEPFMAAMEMIHTHSLIHDDLPAMDNDEYRRGRKTTHVVFGEAMAILAGDALLNYAYETAAKAFSMEPGNERIGRAFQTLAAKTGITGMIGGQSVDVESEGLPLTREKLDFIYELKTGALIEGSMMIGAILAGATEEQVELIRRVALDVGIAFQIQDDILDITSTTEVLGKPVNSDEKNHKTTVATLEGLDKAKSEVERISNEAIHIMEELDGENPFLKELILQLIHREK